MTPTVLICEPRRTPLRLQLGPDPIEVGRDCGGLLITDAQVSRRHLELRRDGATVVVVDLGSTNGTRIDGIPFTGSQRLHEGQVVQLGATTIQLVADAGAVPATGLRTTSIDLVSDRVLASPENLAAVVNRDRTATIVFSDIEDSTRRAVELGDAAWMRCLEAHNAIVRRHLARHGGREIKTLGDGFMLTFPSARSGVRAMIDVQRAVDEYSRSMPAEATAIRVGIHTGEAMAADDGDLVGRHVIMASRIANAAAGGEILVSPVVVALVTGRPDIRFGERRYVSLKGLSEDQPVHSVLWRPDEPPEGAAEPPATPS